MKVFLIIPAYNEQERILNTLKFYVNIFKKEKIPLKIIVVSESTDRTNSIIRAFAGRYKNVSLVYSKRRLGKGGAIARGFNAAISLSSENDAIGFVDADNAIYASETVRMLRYLKAHKEFSGIIASRYTKGSEISGHVPVSRRIASRAYNYLVRLLFGLEYNDTQCGAKIFRQNAIKKVLPSLTIVDMSFDINLLYSASRLGFKVKEFPIKYRQVNEGTKLVMHTQIPQMFIATIGFRISRSRLGALIPDSLKGYIYNKVRRW
jgi:glycosyltransferase involved in cell wall biosynthesis